MTAIHVIGIGKECNLVAMHFFVNSHPCEEFAYAFKVKELLGQQAFSFDLTKGLSFGQNTYGRKVRGKRYDPSDDPAAAQSEGFVYPGLSQGLN